MYNKILVPVDLADTDLAKPAISTAVEMARSAGGSVRLVNVLAMTPVMLAEYVPPDFDVQQRKSAVFAYTEAGNRVIAAVGRKQKPTMRREDDAACALKRVRCAFLAADRLEHSGTGTACRQTSHLGKFAARRSMIVHYGVAGLIRLHV